RRSARSGAGDGELVPGRGRRRRGGARQPAPGPLRLVLTARPVPRPDPPRPDPPWPCAPLPYVGAFRRTPRSGVPFWGARALQECPPPEAWARSLGACQIRGRHRPTGGKVV